MTDNSLNNRMFANIHMNVFGNINSKPVADDIAKASEILIDYFGYINRSVFNN